MRQNEYVDHAVEIFRKVLDAVEETPGALSVAGEARYQTAATLTAGILTKMAEDELEACLEAMDW